MQDVIVNEVKGSLLALQAHDQDVVVYTQKKN